jgi:hypothetical protein
MQIHSARAIPAPVSFACSQSRSANGENVPVPTSLNVTLTPFAEQLRAVEQITEADVVEMLGEPVPDMTPVAAQPPLA